MSQNVQIRPCQLCRCLQLLMVSVVSTVSLLTAADCESSRQLAGPRLPGQRNAALCETRQPHDKKHVPGRHLLRLLSRLLWMTISAMSASFMWQWLKLWRLSKTFIMYPCTTCITFSGACTPIVKPCKLLSKCLLYVWLLYVWLTCMTYIVSPPKCCYHCTHICLSPPVIWNLYWNFILQQGIKYYRILIYCSDCQSLYLIPN